MASFCIIGDAFVDLLCFLTNNAFPEPGGDAELKDPVKALAGGSGINTCTHLQSMLRLTQGQSVFLYTALNPEDDYGRLLLTHAEQHGFHLINCRPQHASTASTGHCLAIVADRERSFMTHRGCMAEFSPHDITVQRMMLDHDDDEGPLHIHVAGYYNMPHFWNGTLAKVLCQLRNDRQHLLNKATVISLVPQHDASGQWDGGIDFVIESCLDFLVLNLLEATRIMRRRRGVPVVDDNEPELDEVLRFYQRLSPTVIVVVTRGAKGAVAFSNGQVLAELSESVAVEVEDPTGAGDTFVAGFLQGIWAWKKDHDAMNDTGWPRAAIRAGLRLGCAYGTASVQIKGASIPADESQVSMILERQKEVV